MTDPRRRPVLLVASVLVAMVPVMFGVIRALTTGGDVRYLWLAGAAIAGAMGVMPLWRGTSGPPHVSLGRALAAMAAGTISAGVVALMMGTRAGPGIAIVAGAFGLCTGTSAILATLARQSGAH